MGLSGQLKRWLVSFGESSQVGHLCGSDDFSMQTLTGPVRGGSLMAAEALLTGGARDKITAILSISH